MGELFVRGGQGPEGCGRPQHNRAIKMYFGTVEEHPHLHGLCMRQGEGKQRWADGRVYSGQWQNHCYHGEGAIWHTEADYVGGLAHAYYHGQWCRGKRHGYGVFRFQQLSRGGERKAKVYDGQFENDVFSGRGRLRVGHAAPELDSPAYISRVPPPRLQTERMLSFEGRFILDPEEAYRELHKSEPRWLQMHPLAKDDLRLETLTEDDRRAGTQLFEYYFGGCKDDRMQEEGGPMPDLALAYYALEGKDTDGIDGSGTMLFTDNSEYVGTFRDGLPAGDGVLVQRRRALADRPPELLARYQGQWVAGERSGTGTYETRNGVVYNGCWVEDRRHGHGVQTVPPASAATYGYARYEGQWDSDQKSGLGRAFSVGEPGKHVLVYSGRWAGDAVRTMENEPAWLHLVHRASSRGRFYNGTLSSQSLREGCIGFLYDETMGDEEAFLQALDAGKPFVEDDRALEILARGDAALTGDEGAASPIGALALTHTLYIGPWKNNFPSGFGIQHFKGIGVFAGQFVDGKRHGRGVWMKSDRSMTYHPIKDGGCNWQGDAMHGVAVVETPEGLHADIQYEGGVCKTWRPGLSGVKAISSEICPPSSFHDPMTVCTLVRERKTLARS